MVRSSARCAARVGWSARKTREEWSNVIMTPLAVHDTRGLVLPTRAVHDAGARPPGCYRGEALPRKQRHCQHRTVRYLGQGELGGHDVVIGERGGGPRCGVAGHAWIRETGRWGDGETGRRTQHRIASASQHATDPDTRNGTACGVKGGVKRREMGAKWSQSSPSQEYRAWRFRRTCRPKPGHRRS